MANKDVLNGVAWKQSEIDLLVNFGDIDYTDLEHLSKLLNRSVNSVRNKAIKLNLYKRNRCAKFWSKEELEYLEDNYPIKNAASIAKTLKRSINSVKAKAQSMGFEVDYNALITASYIAKAVGVYGTTVSDWINKKGLKAKSHMRGKTKFYTINEIDFWKWAETNTEYINWSKVNSNMFISMPYWAKEAIWNYKTINSRKQFTIGDIKKICALNGKTNKYIASKLGRSVSSIGHIKYKINKGEYAYES